jgi:hypothetical protein
MYIIHDLHLAIIEVLLKKQLRLRVKMNVTKILDPIVIMTFQTRIQRRQWNNNLLFLWINIKMHKCN